MRHDAHFVEALTSGRGGPVGKMVPVDQLEPNPDQPRKEFGDLSDLVSSVQEKGVLAPILVRRIGTERFQIIAGERRYRASLEAGLLQVPCIELEVDERGVLEISLIENLQRQDLSAFEEADAVAVLSDKYNYTHEAVARKLGKSRSTVTEIFTVAKIPVEVRVECRRADIEARRLLVEIGKCGDVESMLEMVRKIREGGLQRDDARAISKAKKDGAERAKPYVFRFQPEDRSFRLQLQFQKTEVERSELIGALRGLLRSLEADERGARRKSKRTGG